MRTEYPTHEPAPYAAKLPAYRYRWLDPDFDHEIQHFHQNMPNGAPGLYLLWDPLAEKRVLVEAYRAWELPRSYLEPKMQLIEGREVWMSRHLMPCRWWDAKAGLLVAMEEVGAYDRQLTNRDYENLRAGSRAWRLDYAGYRAPAEWRAAELRNAVREDRERRYQAAIADPVEEMVDRFMHESGAFPLYNLGDRRN